MVPRAATPSDGDDRVAVAAPHVAFPDLGLDHLEAPTASHEIRDRVDLLAPHMVELEYPQVEDSTVHAAVREVHDDDAACLDESARAGRADIRGVASCIRPVVGLLTVPAVRMEAVSVLRRAVEAGARQFDLAPEARLHVVTVARSTDASTSPLFRPHGSCDGVRAAASEHPDRLSACLLRVTAWSGSTAR